MTRCRMQRMDWNKRLLASTRGKILALLRSENRTVNELAAALLLTDNAVRGHLLSLERDGLVQQQGTRPGKRKPHATYGLSTEAERVFPKAYGTLLAHFVTVLSNRLAPSVPTGGLARSWSSCSGRPPRPLEGTQSPGTD